MQEKILIVDDEEQVRNYLSDYLSHHDYRTVAVACANDAIQALGQHQVDLALLDICLGEEDGIELLQQLKGKQPRLPIVMITGMGFDDDLIRRSHAGGADAFVSKAAPADELLFALRQARKQALTRTRQGATV